MAKKSARVFVGLVCKETGIQNYVTQINKLNTKELEVKKYCPKLGKHTVHVMRKKLD